MVYGCIGRGDIIHFVQVLMWLVDSDILPYEEILSYVYIIISCSLASQPNSSFFFASVGRPRVADGIRRHNITMIIISCRLLPAGYISYR